MTLFINVRSTSTEELAVVVCRESKYRLYLAERNIYDGPRTRDERRLVPAWWGTTSGVK